MSKPLAATSVATRTLKLFARNSLTIVSLLLCLNAPCKAIALMPSAHKAFAVLSVALCVLVNTIIWPSVSVIILLSSVDLRLCSVVRVFCSMFCDTLLRESITTLAGSVKYTSAKFKTLLGKVAENIKVCFSVGKCLIICSIWWIKPSASILSISSQTTYFTLSKTRLLRLIWSFKRPGVPMIKRGFFLSFLSWSCINLPPTISAEGISLPAESSPKTLYICWASSLVGATIRQRASSFFLKISRRGIVKAAVLPLPVCAEAITSLPLSTNGITSACTGIGVE